jgi:hypothetical protein
MSLASLHSDAGVQTALHCSIGMMYIALQCVSHLAPEARSRPETLPLGDDSGKPGRGRDLIVLQCRSHDSRSESLCFLEVNLDRSHEALVN